MSIVPETRFPGKSNAASADYPQGSARNVTVSGDGTGTPWVESLVNDFWGFLQRMNQDAEVTPNGDPDTVLVSQYFESMMRLAGSSRRNAIVDGRFDFWFEGVSQTTSGYGSDTMSKNENTESTKVHTRETLLAGLDVPSVPSAEFYSRTVVSEAATATANVFKSWPIENVMQFAGRDIVVTFYARVDTIKNISIQLEQNFGGGGSATVSLIPQKIEIGTVFNRYELTFPVPSVLGKVVGTDSRLDLNIWFDAGSNFNSATANLGHQSGTFELACVQVESGNQATRFEEEDAQSALSRSRRYFTSVANSSFTNYGHISRAQTTKITGSSIPFATPMRVPPAATVFSFGGIAQYSNTDLLNPQNGTFEVISTSKDFWFPTLTADTVFTIVEGNIVQYAGIHTLHFDARL